jgi:flagellar biogenesis protein FliO
MDSTVSQFLAITVVLGGLVAAVWFLKRRQFLRVAGITRGGKGADIQVLSHKPLTGQHVLFVVIVRGEMLLLATSPGSCTLLERLGATEAAPRGNA